MIVLSNSIDQTILPNQSLTFDTVILHTGCAECHREGSGAVGLRAGNSIYDVAFTANVSTATASAPVQLAVAIDGAPLLETTMISTPSQANVFNNIHCDTRVSTCCCNGGRGTVTIRNTGANPVTVKAKPCLNIKRDA